MATYKDRRRCADCYDVRIKEICNGLGKAIDNHQKVLIEKAGGRHVSKEKAIKHILRKFFEL